MVLDWIEKNQSTLSNNNNNNSNTTTTTKSNNNLTIDLYRNNANNVCVHAIHSIINLIPSIDFLWKEIICQFTSTIQQSTNKTSINVTPTPFSQHKTTTDSIDM